MWLSVHSCAELCPSAVVSTPRARAASASVSWRTRATINTYATCTTAGYGQHVSRRASLCLSTCTATTSTGTFHACRALSNTPTRNRRTQAGYDAYQQQYAQQQQAQQPAYDPAAYIPERERKFFDRTVVDVNQRNIINTEWKPDLRVAQMDEKTLVRCALFAAE